MKRKIVLITGCSSGFGLESAVALAQSNYVIFAGVRNTQSDGAKRLRILANRNDLNISIIKLDVDSEVSVKNAIAQILKKTSRIDVLINNAGYGTRGPIEDFSIDEVKAQFETNVFGVLRMIKAVSPIMRKQKSGLIINFSSISGLVSFPLFSIYSASKYAIETITEGLWFELKHFGISVCMVEPGSFKTSFSNNRKDAGLMYRENSPYKKLITTFDSRYIKTHAQVKGLTSKQKGPEQVADVIAEIIESGSPKLRYRIGMDAHKNYWIRKLLPDFLWMKLLRKIYKW